VLCKKIASDNLWTLVQFLLDGLVDHQGHSSSGSCVVLNQIIKLRGKSLEDQVRDTYQGVWPGKELRSDMSCYLRSQICWRASMRSCAT